MSNYRAKAFNPVSHQIEDADYIDDYYGSHRYGIRFDDGTIHPISHCGIEAAATAIETLTREKSALEESWRETIRKEREVHKHTEDLRHAVIEEKDHYKARAEAAEAQVKEAAEVMRGIDETLASQVYGIWAERALAIVSSIRIAARSYLDKHAPAAISEDE